MNKLRSGLKIAAVKAPGFGENRKNLLQDIAALTGATVITDDIGMKLEDASEVVLGLCKQIEVSKDSTVILDGLGEQLTINDRISQIESDLEQTES